MTLENKDFLTPEATGTLENHTLTEQVQATESSEQQEKLVTDPQEKEQDKIKLLLEKFDSGDKNGERNTEIKEKILELSQNDPFLVSAFLSNFVEAKEKGFPTLDKPDKEKTEEEKRWDYFNTVAKELTSSTSKEEGAILLSRSFDAWKSAWTEHSRIEQNNKRVLKKQEIFIHQFLEKNPNYDKTTLNNECNVKKKEQGTLTFEVFLDDINNNTSFLQEGNLNFSELYKRWESKKIEKIGRENMDIKKFEQMLLFAKNNNESLKEEAKKEVQKYRGTGLTEQEIAIKIEEIYNQKLQTEVDKYGMLNQTELIKTAFVGLKPQDYNSTGLFFQKIQIIGRLFYDNNSISTEGAWGPQTEAVLLSLRRDLRFEDCRGQIDAVLKNNKSYGEKAKKISQELTENYKPGLFDRKKFKNSQLEKSEINSSNNERAEKRQQRKIVDSNTSLNQALEDLSINEVEATIPRETYLKAINDFIKQQKPLPEELASDLNLAENILDGKGNGEAYEAFKNLWETSKSKQEFIAKYKEELQSKIKKTLIESAKGSRDVFFKSVGLPISYDAELSRTYEKYYKKAEGSYSVFRDANHPNEHYIYNHTSGYLSARKMSAFDAQKKEIDLNAEEYEIILKFPTAQEQISQALDISSYLPNLRSTTEENLEETIHDGLKNKLAHTAGAVETSLIASNIEKNRLQLSIFNNVKEIFQINHIGEHISESGNRAYYQILVPLMNTLKTANTADLKEMDAFFEDFHQFYQEHANGNVDGKKISGKSELFKHCINPLMLKELNTGGNARDKSEFGIGILMQALETTPPGKAGNLEDKILDIKKINFLNHEKDSKLLENNAEYGKRYKDIKNTLSMKENIVRENIDQGRTNNRLEHEYPPLLAAAYASGETVPSYA